MYLLRKFHNDRYDRINSIIDSLSGYISNNINLIGSSTLPFPSVCKIMSLPATACRVEGYLDSRYFPGSYPIDEAENVADNSLRKIFSISDDYEISLHPHSATQSNHAIWNSILKSGSIVMGLSLTDGGHISHILGLPNGTIFEPFKTKNNEIDYDLVQKKAKEINPTMIIGGGTAYPLDVNYLKLKVIASSVGAHLHADIAHTGPFIASGIHSPVFPYADSVTIETGKNFRGPKGGILIFRKNISTKVRKALFPKEQSSPNQINIIAKTCTFEEWNKINLKKYAINLKKAGNILANTFKENGISLVYRNTDTHLVLIDLRSINITGHEGETILEKNNILANRNQIPNDDSSPWVCSGLRFGVTTLVILGYSNDDIMKLGRTISSLLKKEEQDLSVISNLLQKYHFNTSNISSVPMD